MKLIKQILFSSIIMICASMATFAQKQDDKKPPPKQDPPPKVIVKDKDKPREDRPKNDNSNRPRRPDGEMSGIFQLIKPIIE